MDCKFETKKRKDKLFDPNKPYIISAQRYDQLVELSTAQSRRAKQEIKEQRVRNWQKTEGEALNSKFTGKKIQTLQDKLVSQKADLKKTVGETTKQLNAYKENDEKIRREKIKKAEQMIDKFKPGPRLLHGAAMQSEVLRERNLQMSIKKEFDLVIQDEEQKLAKSCVSLNNPWIKDEQKLLNEKNEKVKIYKKEMLKAIDEKARQKSCYKKRLLEEECAERDRVNEEIKCRIEKERLAMETKRKMLRQNAIEAMKMVEQRRQRERMMEEVEDRLNCVYNNGKRELNNMVKANMENAVEERSKIINENAKHLPNNDHKQLEEDERLRHDLDRMQLKFTAAEMEKKRKEKAAKQARIEAHLQFVENQKKMKANLFQQQLFDMAQRFKNDDVNMAFKKSQNETKLQQLEQFRSILKEQLAEKERKQNEEHDCLLDDPYMQDDKKFFELARKYITDAKEKDRPLYPFIKAVEQYKRENQIDCVSTLPKHLLSQILIGCRQAEKQNISNVPKMNTGKEESLQECIKTTELLNSAWQKEQSRNERFARFGPPGNCSKIEQKSVPNTSVSPSRKNCRVCHTPTKQDVCSKNEEKNTKPTAENDVQCNKDKIRYSMSHLKYINHNQSDI